MDVNKEKYKEFMKYIETKGVTSVLLKVLLKLYKEPHRPGDPLEYIRNKLAREAHLDTYNNMSLKLHNANGKINELKREIAKLKTVVEEDEDSLITPIKLFADLAYDD